MSNYLDESGVSYLWDRTKTIVDDHYVTAGEVDDIAAGTRATAEGYNNTASGSYSHAEGYGTASLVGYAHAEGYNTLALGESSHAEGKGDYDETAHIKLSGDPLDPFLPLTFSFTSDSPGMIIYEGDILFLMNSPEYHATVVTVDISNHELTLDNYLAGTTLNDALAYVYRKGQTLGSIGAYSHAEGHNNLAMGDYSHAEGEFNISSGSASHAEGSNNEASGYYSHAEGYYNTASGYDSHAEGYGTVAQGNSQHVFGKYNIADSNHVEIVGNGTFSARSNARTLDWNGNEVLAGKLTVGTAPVNNMDVATKQYVDTAAQSVLPSVTQSDDGKILKVDSGEWIVGEASRDTFLVTLTRNPTTYKLESDKTPTEIGEAVDAGKSILINKNASSPVSDGIYYATYANTSGGVLTKLLGYSRIDQVYDSDRHCRYRTIDEIKFTTDSGWVLSSQKISLQAYEFTGQNSGDSTMTQKAITDAINAVLPSVTSSDNGKVLTVSNGSWDKMNVPTELPTVTTSDNGKILGVQTGVWGKMDVPTELPSVTSSDNGKVLGVQSGAWGKMDVPTELPSVTSSDNGKVLTVVEGSWSKAEPGGSSSTPVPISYSELVTLYNGNNLVPGTQYRITDYETIINGTYNLGNNKYLPYASSAGHQFDIIVTADGTNSLKENASAALHSGDTYFADSEIDFWQLKYDINNDTVKYSWAANNGKGVIYWMKDEWNNEAGYDFKNIQFLRYALKQASGSSGTFYNLVYSNSKLHYGSPYHVYTARSGQSYKNPFEYQYENSTEFDYDFAVESNILNSLQYEEITPEFLSSFQANLYYTFDFYDTGEGRHIDLTTSQQSLTHICKDNVIQSCLDYFNKQKIGLGANVFMQSGYFNNAKISCVSNVIGFNCNFNTLPCSLNNQLIGENFSNILAKACESNIIGLQSHDNIIESESNNNNIGQLCYSNVLGGNCASNTIKGGCYSNTFLGNSVYNTLGYGCYSNTLETCVSNIIENYCYSNILSSSCDNNYLGYNCYYNSLYYGSQKNKIASGSNYNTFNDECIENVLGFTCDHNTFSSGCYNNVLGDLSASNSLGEGCYNNVLGYHSISNYLGENCYYNVLGNDTENNTLQQYCFCNILETGCQQNTIGDASYNNFLGCGCYYNTFDSSCEGNVLGSGCSRNSFGTESNHNTLGNYCSYNALGDYCVGNSFGNECYDNEIVYSGDYNNFGNGCSDNILGYDSVLAVNYCTFLQGISNTSITSDTDYGTVEKIVVKSSFASSSQCELYDPVMLDNNFTIEVELIADGKLVMSWQSAPLQKAGKYKASESDPWTSI